MNSVLVTVVVIAAVTLIIVQHIVFERGLRRARQNGTGVYRFSLPVRRVIAVGAVVVFIALEIWRWQTP